MGVRFRAPLGPLDFEPVTCGNAAPRGITSGWSTLLVNMNDRETQRQALSDRRVTAAEWWEAHPEEHEPRSARALGIALVVLAVVVVALVVWAVL